MRRIPLLDLGNVVIKVDFAPFVAWLAERSEDRDAERAQSFLKSSLFYDFEFGAISRAEFAARVASLYKANITQAEVEERFCDIFPGLVEGIHPLMDELAARGPVYALSNTNIVHLEWLWRHHADLMKKFTKVFASHEMHSRKPYPGIYRDVADELGVRPEELIFFDDMPANVQGARRAGLEAHLFAETGQVSALLKPGAEKDDRS